MTNPLRISLDGTVDKIILSPRPKVPEKAQIKVEERDGLNLEIRIGNILKNENEEDVGLKFGARVKIIIEAKNH